MIYFDNAATSFPKAPGVGPAMARFLANDAANPGRAGHRMATRAEAMLDDARLKIARLFNITDPHRVIFTMNGTDALNIAIKGVLGERVGKGQVPGKGPGDVPSDVPGVVTTVLEHNSVSRPLQAMAERGDIELTRLACDADGFIDPADVAAAITDRTVLVAMTHASNVLGTIQDAAAVGRVCRDKGVLFLLDAAQTAGVVPIDVAAMQIDLLALPGHKSLLGPTGIGVLYVGDRAPAPSEQAGGGRLSPWREGGTGGDSATPTQPALFPYYLEGGTPNTVGVAGLVAGIDHVLAHGIDATLAHEQAMVQQIIDRFADDERFTIYGTRDAKRRVGTIALNIRGFDAPDVGSILDDSFEIAVRPGLHCSPYIHRQLGTFPDGAVRISPGAFNTYEELAQVIDALEQIAG